MSYCISMNVIYCLSKIRACKKIDFSLFRIFYQIQSRAHGKLGDTFSLTAPYVFERCWRLSVNLSSHFLANRSSWGKTLCKVHFFIPQEPVFYGENICQKNIG